MSFKFNPFSGNFDQVDANYKGLVQANLYDPSSTTLPTGTSATIDGVSVSDGDRVLFSNLSSNNNRIYKVSGVGVSLSWTAIADFDGSQDPSAGNLVSIEEGTGFAGQIANFDGTNWSVNENIRLFDGTNYQEISSIKKSTLTDNATTDVIDVTFAGSENMEISYSIVRGSNKESGKLYVTGLSTTADVTRHATTAVGDVQIDFAASIAAGNIKLQATAASTGSDATMTYFVIRWSDSTGGPGGIPNYAAASSSTPAAGSTTGDIQYRGSDGNLAADADFNWDAANNNLDLAGFEIGGLVSFTLNDNQASAATILSFSATSYHHAVLDYSIERAGDYRTGRLLIVTDETTASDTGDHIETADPGITLSTTVSGGNVLLQYTSTSTGSSGTFKYSIRRWN